MSRPLVVKPEYYALIEKCWKFNPRDRPTSKFVVKKLKEFLFSLIDQENETLCKT